MYYTALGKFSQFTNECIYVYDNDKEALHALSAIQIGFSDNTHGSYFQALENIGFRVIFINIYIIHYYFYV